MTQLPVSNHPIAINMSLSIYCKLIFMLSSNPPFRANVCLRSSSKCTFFFFPSERENYSSVLYLEAWEDSFDGSISCFETQFPCYWFSHQQWAMCFQVKHLHCLRVMLFNNASGHSVLAVEKSLQLHDHI